MVDGHSSVDLLVAFEMDGVFTDDDDDDDDDDDEHVYVSACSDCFSLSIVVCFGCLFCVCMMVVFL